MKSGNELTKRDLNKKNFKENLKIGLMATRPKTLTAALVPIAVGTSLAFAIQGTIRPLLIFLGLLSALFIQIGTNFANDLFDFLKGADNEQRQGPLRAVQQGWIHPSKMLLATTVVFSLAFLAAIPFRCQFGQG